MCSINYNLNVLFFEHNKSLETKKNKLPYEEANRLLINLLKAMDIEDSAPEDEITADTASQLQSFNF